MIEAAKKIYKITPIYPEKQTEDTSIQKENETKEKETKEKETKETKEKETKEHNIVLHDTITVSDNVVVEKKQIENKTKQFCSDEKKSVYTSTNGKDYCIFDSTAEKLKQRGWVFVS